MSMDANFHWLPILFCEKQHGILFRATMFYHCNPVAFPGGSAGMLHMPSSSFREEDLETPYSWGHTHFGQRLC